MAARKYIQLPKEYLSYSQMQLWKSSPERYKAQYFDKRTDMQYTNAGQEFGKMFADALEKAEETGDLLVDAAMLLLPKYDVRDVQFYTEMKTAHGWLKLVIKPDFFNSETKEFIEIKTGKVPWTPSKAQKHPQMIFYATGIGLEHGVWNDKAILAWAETEQVTDETGLITTQPTGHIETFPVTFTKSQYLEFQAEMIRVALEIELAWASHETREWVTTF